MTNAARYCASCGTPRRPGARFCANCGQAFNAAAPAAVEPQATAPPRIRAASLLFGGESVQRGPHIVSGVSGALIGAALGGAFKSVFFGGIPPFLELRDTRSFRYVFVPIIGACVLGAITGFWSAIFGGGRGGGLPVWAAAAAVAGVFFAYLLLGLRFSLIPRVFQSGIFAIGFLLSALFAAAFALGTSWPWWKRLTGRA